MNTLSSRVQQGFDVFRYEIDSTPTTILALVDKSQLADVNTSLDYVLNDLSSVMLAPGGGQGGGSFRQPATYDSSTGTWTYDPYTLVLHLQGDPLAWTLTNGGNDFLSGQAAVDGAKTSTLDVTLAGQQLPLATGTLSVGYTNTSLDGCNVYSNTVTATYTDGTTSNTFVGGPLCNGGNVTKLGVDQPYPNLGMRHEELAIRWQIDASGRADAVITGTAAPQTVHATECWLIDSTVSPEATVVVYYSDDSGLNATIGDVSQCPVDAAP
jgi:hypothetical protein